MRLVYTANRLRKRTTTPRCRDDAPLWATHGASFYRLVARESFSKSQTRLCSALLCTMAAIRLDVSEQSECRDRPMPIPIRLGSFGTCLLLTHSVRTVGDGWQQMRGETWGFGLGIGKPCASETITPARGLILRSVTCLNLRYTVIFDSSGASLLRSSGISGHLIRELH